MPPATVPPRPPHPSNDFLTLGYVAMTVPDHAFWLFNIYTQSQDCRLINIHFCPSDNSYRILWSNNTFSTRELCYRPFPRGTVVPQAIWQPQQAGDRQRHVVDAGLLWPIFFIEVIHTHQGTIHVPGFNMLQVLNAVPTNLLNATTDAPMGGLATTHLCLKWPGYGEYKRQIEIQNHHQPITLSKLLERIAKFVDRFIREVANERVGGQWRVGPEGMITQANIYIVGLVHVSKGVWQPILQLNGLNFHFP